MILKTFVLEVTCK